MTGTVTVNGARLAYRFDGPEKGRVVLMSNSLMSSYDMWDWTVPALADRYRVLRYDTRGHGRSSTPPGPWSIAALADDAAGLLDALGIEAAHFVGLSMGGMVGQQLGARFPARVLSLSLCDTASEMPPREMWEERLAIARSQGIAALAEGTLKRWFTEPFARRAPGDIEKVRAMILGTGVEGYMACACAIRDMAQTTMLLAITAPTLVLTGRQDPATTVAHATVLHRVIAGSRLVILEDAAHLSNIEQPEAFNAALRAFIDEVDDRLPAA
ncbi:MAG TPA: 3-oxoadipate enol-lactonase [Usitatibacteraceae bacterium]|nr:3-oxoadipate enol-lactonase [Usitatibacteraceae bacterium]